MWLWGAKQCAADSPVLAMVPAVRVGAPQGAGIADTYPWPGRVVSWGYRVRGLSDSVMVTHRARSGTDRGGTRGLGHTFSLPLVAIDMLLEHQRLGRAPFPFEVPHMGTTHEHRAQIREAVFRELERSDLMRGGRLDADVEQALDTAVKAPVAITLAAQLDSPDLLVARAATNRRSAVLAKQDGNMLVFEELRPGDLVPAIVDLLPRTPPEPGQSLTVARPVSRPRRSADAGYDPFAGVAAPRPVAGAQERAVSRLFEKERLRAGQFNIIVPGASVPPATWFDTPDGRTLCTQRAGDDGRQWLTYAPADNARITQHLRTQVDGFL